MDGNAEERLAAALDDDATAELFSEAPPVRHAEPPDPDPSSPPPPPSTPFQARSAPAPAAPAPVVEVRPGLVLRGRYVLEEPLATGGTAIVYSARDVRREGTRQADERIAIKFLRPENRNRLPAIESLRREFHYAETLSHPNIARVFDLDCDRGLWFLTLEL